MNLVLLFRDDFVAEDTVRLTGRRLEHVRSVHRAAVGDTLAVGVEGNLVGEGTVTRLDDQMLEMEIDVSSAPPPPLPLTLVLALPRPKVLNRVLASSASLGIKRLYLINAWRVEKSYWSSPRLSPDNLHMQSILGLEQARDTVMPQIELRRLFRPFIEGELPALSADTRRLVAHPHGDVECPRAIRQAATLVIGPEGGFIEREVESLRAIGFTPVTVGPRILRVETAVAAIVGRMF